jgi:hypothetical protein
VNTKEVKVCNCVFLVFVTEFPPFPHYFLILFPIYPFRKGGKEERGKKGRGKKTNGKR